MEVEDKPCVEGEMKKGAKKSNKKLLLLPLLPLLLAIPAAAAMMGRLLKGRKERAAVKALARQLVQERKSARRGGKGGGTATKPRAVIAARKAAEPRMKTVSQVRNLFGKRMIKFVMMALAERIIAAQRAKMKESLPPIPLSGRLSRAKDI